MNPVFISIVLMIATSILIVLWAKLYFNSPFNVLQYLAS